MLSVIEAQRWAQHAVGSSFVTLVVETAGKYAVAATNTRYPLQDVSARRHGLFTSETPTHTRTTNRDGVRIVKVVADATMLVTVTHQNGMARRVLIVIDDSPEAASKRHGSRREWQYHLGMWTICTKGRLTIEEAKQIATFTRHNTTRVGNLVSHLISGQGSAPDVAAELARLRCLPPRELLTAMPLYLRYLGTLPAADLEMIFEGAARCLQLAGKRAATAPE